MTRQELVSLVVELGNMISQYGAVRYATGKNPSEENYNESMTMYTDVIEKLETLADGTLNYLPFEERG